MRKRFTIDNLGLGEKLKEHKIDNNINDMDIKKYFSRGGL